jgi:bidirectional [NiFe] hydrogenase diaphorase subunit
MEVTMTPEELIEIAESEQEAQSRFTQSVKVCVAAGCLSCQGQAVKDAFDQDIKRRGWEKQCQTKGVGCMGLCSEGPLVSTRDGRMYKHVTAADAPEILDSLEGPAVSRLTCPTEIPFFSRQKKIVLENSGVIDAERVEDYIAAL